MLLVGEDSVEECYYLGIAVCWNGLWIWIQWIWLGRIIDACEWIVVHVVEAFVIAPDPCVKNGNY